MSFFLLVIAIALGVALAPYIFDLVIIAGSAAVVIGAIIIGGAAFYWVLTSDSEIATFILYSLGAAMLSFGVYSAYKVRKELAAGAKKEIQAAWKEAWKVPVYSILGTAGIILLIWILGEITNR